jgi:hypothetical protein
MILSEAFIRLWLRQMNLDPDVISEQDWIRVRELAKEIFKCHKETV